DDATAGAPAGSIMAYDAGYLGGVHVAEGNVTNAAQADVITGSASGASHVKVFNGDTLTEVRSFIAFDGFTGGVDVASGDVNGDGVDDVIAVAQNGGNGHVKVFDGATGSLIQSYLGMPNAVGSVSAPAGDVDGDGKADVIVAGSTGGDTMIKAFSGATGAQLLEIDPHPGFHGQLSLAAGDVDGDGKADVITGISPIADSTNVGAG